MILLLVADPVGLGRVLGRVLILVVFGLFCDLLGLAGSPAFAVNVPAAAAARSRRVVGGLATEVLEGGAGTADN